MRLRSHPPCTPHLLAFLAIALAVACQKQPVAVPLGSSATDAPGVPAAPAATSGAPGDARDAVRPGPRVVAACLVDSYAECEPLAGLPALSADGRRVAVPDSGPDSPRGERILTVRVLDVDRGTELRALPMLTYEDRDEGVDDMTGEVAPALMAELDRRIAALDRVLDEGGFRPLAALGTVHEDRPGQEVDGLRATFDGSELTVVDLREGRVRWRRAIGRSKVWKPDPNLDLTCGPFPVADVTVWVSREPGVIVALVTYIGADVCATEYPFLVWR
jgi:hypothetical protein